MMTWNNGPRSKRNSFVLWGLGIPIHHAIRAVERGRERRLLVPEQSRFSERAGLADDDDMQQAATEILVAAASAGNSVIGMRVCLLAHGKLLRAGFCYQQSVRLNLVCLRETSYLLH